MTTHEPSAPRDEVVPSDPILSIVMPAYHAERYIERAIESILTQTFTDFELIVYVDGCTDQTASVAERAAQHDDRVKVIVNSENVGVCVALNRAIAMAHGTFIGRMDADDMAVPERIERQMSLIASNPGIVVVGSDALHINSNDEVLGLSIAGPRSIADFDDRHSRGELTVVLDGTSLMRRDVFELVGGYDPEMAAAPEVDLHSRMAAHGAVVAIDEPLLLYRLHAGSSVDAHFYDGRRIHRFVEARNRALLLQETPPTFQEYLARERSAPLWRRIATRLSDLGQYHYRVTGVRLAEGRKGAAAASLLRALLADPRFVARRAWHRRFSPQARRQIHNAAGS